MLSIFSCVYLPAICLLWRNIYLSLLPLCDWVCVVVVVELYESFVYEIVLSCCSLNCKFTSSVLHLYPPLLMISNFGGIIVHG